MKRHAWIVAAVAALSAVTVACSAPAVNPPPASAVTPDSHCNESLAAYCARTSCPSFDEVAAYARKPEAPGTFMRFDIGTCGAYRFIHLQEGMGDGTDYYDASGKLVSSSSVADTKVCGDEFSTLIGDTPKCEMKVLEHGDWSKPAAD
ncbi:MAG: hypothetical protein ABI183_03760 [Polyangiaceae bacterium]